jgi:hypothetical protein
MERSSQTKNEDLERDRMRGAREDDIMARLIGAQEDAAP